MNVYTGEAVLPRVAVDEDHMFQVGAIAQCFDQGRETRRRRHQYPHVAVGQDMADLGRLQDRVDGHEHAAAGGGAECPDDCLEAFIEKYRDALGAPDAEPDEAAREVLHLVVQPLVAPDIVAELQCIRRRGSAGGRLDQLM